uniref:Kinesin motor domain-containing protein n=1 Tax=Romanomermis culicivorax TaxID=13658 RepID=A0A915IJV6_ROMCU
MASETIVLESVCACDRFRSQKYRPAKIKIVLKDNSCWETTVCGVKTTRENDGKCLEKENENCLGDVPVKTDGSFSGFKYLIWISFAEIYNQYAYDLLDVAPNSENKRRIRLKLSEDSRGLVYVKGTDY